MRKVSKEVLRLGFPVALCDLDPKEFSDCEGVYLSVRDVDDDLGGTEWESLKLLLERGDVIFDEREFEAFLRERRKERKKLKKKL